MNALPRYFTCITLAFAAISVSGCSRQPIASGQILEVILGDKPVMRAGETGSWSGHSYKAGDVEIYDTCIIVTEPDGTKHSAPPERFSIVTFK